MNMSTWANRKKHLVLVVRMYVHVVMFVPAITHTQSTNLLARDAHDNYPEILSIHVT